MTDHATEIAEIAEQIYDLSLSPMHNQTLQRLTTKLTKALQAQSRAMTRAEQNAKI